MGLDSFRTLTKSAHRQPRPARPPAVSFRNWNWLRFCTIPHPHPSDPATATVDTTLPPNGPYAILLQATDSKGTTMTSALNIIVGGNYKPGRVTTTVTDLVVPAPGLPIQIQRTYDSLTRPTSSDFGNGWSLGVNVQIGVSPTNDVTLTLNGQRRTFYFTPNEIGFQSPFGFVPNLIGVYLSAYTPEPGMYGTLAAAGSDMIASDTGCLFDWLLPAGNTFTCYGAGVYSPTVYVYTDPYGRVYTIGSDGSLKSIKDLAGNTLTVTPNGIFSSNGLNVPFVRDTHSRITQITDPLGNVYKYAYDANGNLSAVTYPSNPGSPNLIARYTYDPTHLYTGGTDPRGNALPSTAYYPDGKLQSVTDALGQETSYVYNLATHTTTVTNPDNGTATMVYDSYGSLLTSADPLGHTTTNGYDANHNPTSVTDPLNHTTSYAYDSNGNRTGVTYPPVAGVSVNTTSHTSYNAYSEPAATTDELGNSRTFAYDTNFWPQLAADSLGPVVSFTFNTNGTMASKAVGFDLTQTPGTATTYTYDAYGNLTSQTDPLGRQTTSTYDTLGRLVTTTPPSGGTTTDTYDALGRLTNLAAPLGRNMAYTYDNNGNKLTETDANGKVTHYLYDALNRLQTVTYPDSTTTQYTYDWRNNALTTTDQANRVTQNVYDAAGRLASVTTAFGTPDAATTAYTYYDDGRKATETDPLNQSATATDIQNHTRTYHYDEAGRLVSVVDGQQQTTSYAYDDAGNQVSVTDPRNKTTKQEYDARRRLTTTTYADGTKTKYTYDGPGNLASVTDQAGKVVNYTYDSANQLRSVVQTASPNPQNTTQYTYDPNGNLANLIDANTHTTQNAFDALNQLHQETMPAGQSQTRTYDAAGNLLTLTDYNGHTSTYAYDGLNRLTTKTPDPTAFPGDPGVTFTYTATGKRHTMIDASGTTTYGYDNLDRLITKATPQGTLAYTYDPAGNVASMNSSNTNGVSVNYTYDNLNRLATVVDNRLPVGQNTTTYSYDPASNLATVTYPNGLSSTFSYDDLNRLKALNHYQYTLGPAGNRQSATEPNGRTLNWSYDGIYRLTNETISLDPHSNNGTVSYGLDPVGNRLNQNSTLPGISTASFSYDADDRILSSETYDYNGNTLTTGNRTFTYDFENRLKSMALNNGPATVSLQYDGDGNRVAKTVGGVTTRYLVDDLNPTGYAQVIEEIGSAGVQRIYTYGFQRISQNQLIGSTWAESFYGYDGDDVWGSVRLLTDAAATVTDTYDYDAWGNAVNTTGSTPNLYLYRGEQFDPDLNLYYLRARYYNPITGLLLTRDPYDGDVRNPVTLHKYLYSIVDPVNHVDPTGKQAIAAPRGALEYTLLLAISVGVVIEMERVGAGESEFWRQTKRSLQCAADLVICLEKYGEPFVSSPRRGPKGGRAKPRPGKAKVDCGACGRQCEKEAIENPDSDPWPYSKCPL